MKVTITQKQAIPHIPSASGIEVVDGKIYIIGDDVSRLFILDEHWNPAGEIPLFESTVVGRIVKKEKPDLEGMTVVTVNGKKKLLILGSGSAELRERGFMVDLDGQYRVQEVSLSALYAQVRGQIGLTGEYKLNIEGVASNATTVYLMQRGNVSGKNTVIAYPAAALVAYLAGEEKQIPQPQINTYELPRIGSVASGFSGGAMIGESRTLLFTASVEDTADEINDGESLGSFVGVLSMDDKNTQPVVALLEYEGKTYTGKVESISIVSARENGEFTALAVTDNDGAESEILRIEGQWK